MALTGQIFSDTFGNMKKPIPTRKRPGTYSKLIRAMKKGSYLYFAGANPASIKSIASRIGFEEGKIYYTQKEDGGVNCWCET